MPDFWKASAVVLLAVILGTAIGKNEKDLSMLLNLATCCIVSMIAMEYLSPVVNYLWQISSAVEDAGVLLGTLLKITAVAIGTELIGMVSSDAGSNSLTKVMQLLGTSLMLYLSLPIFELLFSMIEDIVNI